MTRRSTRLGRLENSLYTYNAQEETWNISKVVPTKITDQQNLFDLGSYFTCKHMSQKVNPLSFRLGANKTWHSSWYSSYKNVGTTLPKLQKDLIIRKYITKIFSYFNILTSSIYIKEKKDVFLVRAFIYELGTQSKKDTLLDFTRKKRFSNYTEKEISRNTINPFYKKADSSKMNWVNMPFLMDHVENLLKKLIGVPVHISVHYQEDLGNSATLLASYLVKELEKPKMNFKKALKGTFSKISSSINIRGLRVNCSGRLGRAPMAKMEWFKYGSIPLTKISADIDYQYLTGTTKYGSFGIKVWLYKY